MVATAVPAPLAPAVPRRQLALVLLCAARFMIVRDVSIVNVALPSMRRDLGVAPAGRPGGGRWPR